MMQSQILFKIRCSIIYKSWSVTRLLDKFSTYKSRCNARARLLVYSKNSVSCHFCVFHTLESFFCNSRCIELALVHNAAWWVWVTCYYLSVRRKEKKFYNDHIYTSSHIDFQEGSFHPVGFSVFGVLTWSNIYTPAGVCSRRTVRFAC
jgi:hypothetical protein